MLVSALSACAVDDSVNISTNISVASSAAERYAEWLTDRLDRGVRYYANNCTDEDSVNYTPVRDTIP